MAHHYTAAGMTEQTVSYWQEAGQRATDHFAYAEAMAHFRKGLELLQAQPETPGAGAARVTAPFAPGSRDWRREVLATSQREQYYARAHALSQQVGDVSQLAAASNGDLKVLHCSSPDRAQEKGQPECHKANQIRVIPL